MRKQTNPNIILNPTEEFKVYSTIKNKYKEAKKNFSREFPAYLESKEHKYSQSQVLPFLNRSPLINFLGQSIVKRERIANSKTTLDSKQTQELSLDLQEFHQEINFLKKLLQDFKIKDYDSVIAIISGNLATCSVTPDFKPRNLSFLRIFSESAIPYFLAGGITGGIITRAFSVNFWSNQQIDHKTNRTISSEMAEPACADQISTCKS